MSKLQEFSLFISHYQITGGLLKLWGQRDRRTASIIQDYLNSRIKASNNLNIPSIHSLRHDQMCIVVDEQKQYYRAKITNLFVEHGQVEVILIDYGSIQLLPITNLRSMQDFISDAVYFETKPQQASEFTVANITISEQSADKVLALIKNELYFKEVIAVEIGEWNHNKLINILIGNSNLVSFLLEKGLANKLNISIPFQENLSNNRVKVQPQRIASPLCYKALPFPVGTEHDVYVSYVEDGPYLFSVQLSAHEIPLQKLMLKINENFKPIPVTEPLDIGHPCIVKCNYDDTFCRAVLINIVEDGFKVFLVDFGSTEVLSADRIYHIPDHILCIDAFSARFRLSKLKNVYIDDYIKKTFTTIIHDKVFRMIVTNEDSSMLIKHCELYDKNNVNVLELLAKETFTYKQMTLKSDAIYNILVSHIEGCQLFYIQLNQHEAELNNLMVSIKNSKLQPFSHFFENYPCLATCETTDMYYRAKIVSLSDDKVRVQYVDFGRECEIEKQFLKEIIPDFVNKLPAQAIKCCLQGYQNMDFNKHITGLFRDIAICQQLTMKVIGLFKNNTYLVDLYDKADNNVAAIMLNNLARTVNFDCLHSTQKSLLGDVPSEELKDVDKTDSFKKPNKFSSNKQDENWRRTEYPSRSYDNRRNEMNSQDNRKFRSRKSYEDDSNRSASESERSYGKSNVNGYRNNNRQTRPKRDYQSNKSHNNFQSNNVTRYKTNIQKNEVWDAEPDVKIASFNDKFKSLSIELSTTENIIVCWFFNPEKFFCQLSRYEDDLQSLMIDIQSTYYKKQPIKCFIPVGAPAIAEFNEALYRVTILENNNKFTVFAVDYGNSFSVTYDKIWIPELKHLTLPKQAIECGLDNIKPGDNISLDNLSEYFDRPFICHFKSINNNKYTVSLLNNGLDLKQELINAELAFNTSIDEEPLTLGLLENQLIPIIITHIVNFEIFYINMKSDTYNELKQTLQSIDYKSLKKLPVSDIKNQKHCFVHVDNNDWRRGIISKSDNHEAIEIFLPDFGNTDSYPMEKVYILPKNLFHFYYQALPCGLHNLNPESKLLISNESFEEYLNVDLIMYVDKSEENRMLVTLYDTQGEKIELIEPDEGAYPTIERIIPLVIYNSESVVYVINVESVNAVSIQLESDSKKISALLSDMYEYYEQNTDSVKVEIGNYYAAKSIVDGNWYRAFLESTKNDNYKILYVDYGNYEVLPISNIRQLADQFVFPAFGLTASLKLKEISTDATTKLIELTNSDNYLFNATFEYGDTGWLIDLVNTETKVNLSQTLIDLNLAIPLTTESTTIVEEQTSNNDVSRLEKSVIERDANKITDASLIDITISYINTPNDFNIQMCEDIKTIEALQSTLQEEIINLPNLSHVDVGVICAAKYSSDEMWYRAEILDADDEIVSVRFIDYGNVDSVTNHPDFIKCLPSNLLTQDGYSKKCSLNIKPIKGGEWGSEQTTEFSNVVWNYDSCRARVLYENEKNVAYIELFAGDDNVADVLIKSNSAVPLTEKDSFQLGFISYLQSVSEFWIQLERSVTDLDLISEQLLTQQLEDLHEPCVGMMCAALFPDDEKWYRARIISHTAENITVNFLDYGNSTVTTQLKILPEELTLIPVLAQKCCLLNPNNVSWDEEVTRKLQEISKEGETIFAIRKTSLSETSTIELFLNDENIAELLLKETFEETKEEVLAELVDDKQTEELVDDKQEEELVHDKQAEELVDGKQAEELVDDKQEEELVHDKQAEELVDGKQAEELVDDKQAEELVDDKQAEELVEDEQAEELNVAPVSLNFEENKGMISQLISLSEIWMQYESSIAEIDQINEKLSNVENYDDIKDPLPEMTCLVECPDDNNWYRAKVVANRPEGTEVIFLDHGFSGIVQKLKVIPDALNENFQAHKFSLKLPDNKIWFENATDKLYEMSQYGQTIFTIKLLTDDEVPFVELFIDGENVIEYLTEEINEKKPNELGNQLTGDEITTLVEDTETVETQNEVISKIPVSDIEVESNLEAEVSQTLMDEAPSTSESVTVIDETNMSTLMLDDLEIKASNLAVDSETTTTSIVEVKLASTSAEDFDDKEINASSTLLDNSETIRASTVVSESEISTLADDSETKTPSSLDDDSSFQSFSETETVSALLDESTNTISEDDEAKTPTFILNDEEIGTYSTLAEDLETKMDESKSSTIADDDTTITSLEDSDKPCDVQHEDVSFVLAKDSDEPEVYETKELNDQNVDEVITSSNENKETSQSKIQNTSFTRRSINLQDKIVPGCVSRGVLEVPPQDVANTPKLKMEDKIVPGSINKGIIFKSDDFDEDSQIN